VDAALGERINQIKGTKDKRRWCRDKVHPYSPAARASQSPPFSLFQIF
jgi:hypothetical protein